MTIDDPLARVAYATGTAPLDWAIQLASMMVELHFTVTLARVQDPASYPGLRGTDVTADGCGRRLIGALLDAGWTPPT